MIDSRIPWRTSTRTQSGGGTCVEVGPLTDDTGRIAVRDTKNRAGAMLLVDRSTWAGFVTGLR